MGAEADTSILDAATIKLKPEDFCVTEALALGPASGDANTDFHYLRLRKSGFTTFQAIDAIASFLEVEPHRVTYCGLKDEDAVTDQMIAIPGDRDVDRLEQFNRLHDAGDRFLQLLAYGRYADPLTVGGLAGNAFRIRIRNLPRDLADTLRDLDHALPISVVNYYDTQRFGVPNGPKTTHEIGAALIGDDYDRALRLLSQAQTPEAATARDWQGSPQSFFETLEPRIVAFFMSADSSDKWNKSVKFALEENLGPEQLIGYSRDGFGFVTARSATDLAVALSSVPTIEYRRFRPEGGRFVSTGIARPSLIHPVINIERIEADDVHSDRLSAIVSFFLPSGAYATNVINQLLLSLTNESSLSGQVLS